MDSIEVDDYNGPEEIMNDLDDINIVREGDREA